MSSGPPVALPDPLSLAHLRPRDLQGLKATAAAVGMMALGLALAASPWGGWLAWVAGQMVLALAFLQWFVLLHEAGHRTLFRRKSLNRFVGHVAAVFALIPYQAWTRIHARHHRFTGWQDLDATTALLVPRSLGRLESGAMNVAWALGLPLFSILYRVQNFWNVPRVARYLVRREEARLIAVNVALLAGFYVALAWWVGPARLAVMVGPALLASLAAQDVILLSQHTHMPRHLSGGAAVRPFAPLEQEAFTRSMLFPPWLSRLLLHFDLHELHHMYVRVPGYDLHRIGYATRNAVPWWTWLRGAKRLSGTTFLFGRREQSGFHL